MRGFSVMTETAFQPILDTLYTRQQADRFVRSIDTFIASLYQKGSVEKRLSTLFSIDRSELIRDQLAKEKIPHNDKEKMKDFFIALREFVQDTKVIDLTIAIEPTLLQVQKWSAWIDSNTKEKYLLHIIVDPRIVGGALIGVEGLYKDKSLRKRLRDLSISL